MEAYFVKVPVWNIESEIGYKPMTEENFLAYMEENKDRSVNIRLSAKDVQESADRAEEDVGTLRKIPFL